MMFPSRYHGLFLVMVMVMFPRPTQAQETSLESALEHLRSKVDSGLVLLLPILGGEPLHTWNGTSGLSPSQVSAILYQVAEVLEELKEPLAAFGGIASSQLEPHVLTPVLDDTNIAMRDVERAIALFPHAVGEHEAHAAQTTGCKHDNMSLLNAVELVRDISVTLQVIDETFEFFGISDTE